MHIHIRQHAAQRNHSFVRQILAAMAIADITIRAHTLYQFLADLVLVAHFAFILFVLLGGLLILRWRRLVWLHLPAVFWGVFIEMTGRICPLTPLENYLRACGGGNIYQGDFVAQYLIPLIYPSAFTPEMQRMLAGCVIVINIILYTIIVRMHKRTRQPDQSSPR